jgi:hypothetical protein
MVNNYGKGEEVIDCKDRKCLKFVNPEEHPEAVYGVPFQYDENWGGCGDCQRDYERKKEFSQGVTDETNCD